MAISPTEALRMFNVSKPTLYKDMAEGNISYSLDRKGRRRLDPAELERAYDLRAKKENSDDVKVRKEPLSSNLPEGFVSQQHFEDVKEQLSERIEELKELLDNQHKLLEKASNEKILLIEDQRKKEKTPDWEKSFRALEARLANQEKADKERKEREERMEKQNRALRQALKKEREELEAERSKGLFQKLFG